MRVAISPPALTAFVCLTAAILRGRGHLSKSDPGQWFLPARVFFCNCTWSSAGDRAHRALDSQGWKTSLKAHLGTVWTHPCSEARFVSCMANRPALGKMCPSRFLFAVPPEPMGAGSGKRQLLSTDAPGPGKPPKALSLAWRREGERTVFKYLRGSGKEEGTNLVCAFTRR